MTDMTANSPRRQTYLPHNGQELPGARATDADQPEIAEMLVRELVTEQKRENSKRALPPLSDPEPAKTAPDPTRVQADKVAEWLEEPRPETAVDALVSEMVIEAGEVKAPAKPRAGFVSRIRLPRIALPKPKLKLRRKTAPAARPEKPAPPAGGPRALSLSALPIPAALRNYRPTRKHIILTALALVVLLRPVLVGLLVLVSFWLVLIAYLTIGPDRCAEMLSGLWLRISENRPELAERLRRRADGFAERFDRFLDWLPDSWADRLALPDFSQPVGQQAKDDGPDPFDRLAAEAREI